MVNAARDAEPAHERGIGLIARAIATAEAAGPFNIPAYASAAATVTTVLVVRSLALPDPLASVAAVLAATLLGQEAWLAVRPRPARRAFEVLSWLGEWEFARARSQAGRRSPMSESEAALWVTEVPDSPETRWLRVEVLAWLGRLEEARLVADSMPGATPYARFERLHALDLIDWLSGGDRDEAALLAAVDELHPADGEDRLRADVAMAIRATRMRFAETGSRTALAPMLEARDRVGSRADGQLRRAIWRRRLPVSLLSAIVVVGASWLVGIPFRL